jgi:tryptophan synthase alpha chain
MAAMELEDALRARATGPVHLVPFYPAGFVSLDVTRRVLDGLAEAGASALEVGVPFSDPIADGPTIQAAYHETLQNGITVGDALEAGKGNNGPPRLTMVSYSLVRRQGIDAFLDRLVALGYRGVLCPDLPEPEAQVLCQSATSKGIAPVLLVAPTTPAARRDRIGRLGGGFIYYLSVAGITGERDRLPPELADGVRDMKDRTDLPVCVGFGISRREHVESLHGVADGAIVGSAFVKVAQAARADGADAVVRACTDLTTSLLE